MRRTAALLVALLALLPLAACGDDGGDADGGGSEEATATTGLEEDPIDGRTFEATTLEGETERTLLPGVPIRLGFADDEITVETGCNRLTGGYSLDGPFLVVSDLGGTEVACSPEIMEQEMWLLQALTLRPGFTYGPPDSIVLTHERTLLTLVDVEATDAAEQQDLAGPTWTADTIIDGESARSLPAGVTATVTFADGGTYQVATGCNTGNGTYVATGAGTYTIDPPTLTRERCAEEVMEVEAAIAAVLDGEVSTSITGDRLTLTAGDAGMSFTAGPS